MSCMLNTLIFSFSYYHQLYIKTYNMLNYFLFILTTPCLMQNIDGCRNVREVRHEIEPKCKYYCPYSYYYPLPVKVTIALIGLLYIMWVTSYCAVQYIYSTAIFCIFQPCSTLKMLSPVLYLSLLFAHRALEQLCQEEKAALHLDMPLHPRHLLLLLPRASNRLGYIYKVTVHYN